MERSPNAILNTLPLDLFLPDAFKYYSRTLFGDLGIFKRNIVQPLVHCKDDVT